jgi:hypothetical protein
MGLTGFALTSRAFYPKDFHLAHLSGVVSSLLPTVR